MTGPDNQQQRRAGARRTLYVLLSIVAVFFLGIILKYVLLGG